MSIFIERQVFADAPGTYADTYPGQLDESGWEKLAPRNEDYSPGFSRQKVSVS